MARMSVTGTRELSAMLESLGKDSQEIAKRGLYQGAKIVADAVKANISGLPVTDDYGTPSRPRDGIRAYEKDGLMAGMGVASHRAGGGKVDTSIGFHGYNSRGKPNAVIARSVERGTSFMKANPVVKPALAATRGAAKAAMIREAEEEINKRIK